METVKRSVVGGVPEGDREGMNRWNVRFLGQ